MKTISFSDARRAILTFEAEDTQISQDGEAFLMQAGGTITYQDTPALEEVMHDNRACLLSVTDGDDELLQGRYHVTFLVLEPEALVARISVGDA